MILTILKIIGIVLLSIIGLLLVIVLALCFVPFRYKINASKDDSLIANVKITYLLHFISLKAIYDKKLTIEARILGIRVYKKTSEGGHGKPAKGQRSTHNTSRNSEARFPREPQKPRKSKEARTYQKDEWMQFLNPKSMRPDNSKKLKGEIPDFSEEGWAIRKPRKKK
jgi:hypothetical protein